MASSRVSATNVNYDDDVDENEIEGFEPLSTETEGHNPTRGRQGRGKRTSEVWKDFDLVYKYNTEGNLIEHGVHKKRKHSYNASSSNGTNHMMYVPKYL